MNVLRLFLSFKHPTALLAIRMWNIYYFDATTCHLSETKSSFSVQYFVGNRAKGRISKFSEKRRFLTP